MSKLEEELTAARALRSVAASPLSPEFLANVRKFFPFCFLLSGLFQPKSSFEAVISMDTSALGSEVGCLSDTYFRAGQWI